jgi:hypothetical protein
MNSAGNSGGANGVTGKCCICKYWGRWKWF